MVVITDKKDCCGCTACASICPKNAITLVEDEFGFKFPHVDIDKCISCGLCDLVCPLKNDNKFNSPILSNIGFASDVDEQLTSTSGGLASALSRFFIEKNKGIVYGCSGEDCYHVQHIRVDNVEDISLIKGSKYVQSDLQLIFRRIKQDLQHKLDVLFIGTPCQVAGLRQFLRKDYSGLYCLDFVCHGVPSQKMLSQAIDSLELKSKPSKIAFRYKDDQHETHYCVQLKNKYNEVLYNKGYGRDRYITAFIGGLDYRDSCYNCKFTQQHRIGDITLGDFWNRRNKYTHYARSNMGFSQLHINTEKGMALIKMAAEYIKLYPIDINELLEQSEQLREPMNRHQNSSLFFDIFPDSGFNNAANLALNKFFKAYNRNLFLKRIGLLNLAKYIKRVLLK